MQYYTHLLPSLRLKWVRYSTVNSNTKYSVIVFLCASVQQEHRAGLNRRVPMDRSIQIMGNSFRWGLNSELALPLYKSKGEKRMVASYFCILPSDWPKWFWWMRDNKKKWILRFRHRVSKRDVKQNNIASNTATSNFWVLEKQSESKKIILHTRKFSDA